MRIQRVLCQAGVATGGGVTAVRFGGVIKGDLGRKSGGRGCACVSED